MFFLICRKALMKEALTGKELHFGIFSFGLYTDVCFPRSFHIFVFVSAPSFSFLFFYFFLSHRALTWIPAVCVISFLAWISSDSKLQMVWICHIRTCSPKPFTPWQVLFIIQHIFKVLLVIYFESIWSFSLLHPKSPPI